MSEYLTKTKAKYYLLFEIQSIRAFENASALPVQQRYYNPCYRSYFCFPLSGVVGKLHVKFLLSFIQQTS